jgi:hypothetical protein
VRYRRLHRARYGICPSESVDGAGIGQHASLAGFERLLEQLDRLTHSLGTECDLPEACERGAARRIARLQVGAVEALGFLELSEPEGDLRLDELGGIGCRRLDACREPLPGDIEPQGELLDHLERRDTGARLDPRDVGRRATGEREPALGQAGALACLP